MLFFCFTGVSRSVFGVLSLWLSLTLDQVWLDSVFALIVAGTPVRSSLEVLISSILD